MSIIEIICELLLKLHKDKSYLFPDGTEIGMHDDYSIGYMFKKINGEKYISQMIKINLTELANLIIKNNINKI